MLAQPVYLSFEDKARGDTYVANLEALLDRGLVPKEFAMGRDTGKSVGAAIQDYRIHTTPPASDRPLLDVLSKRLGDVPILGVDYEWAERWVAQMKRIDHLAPGTIRHYVGALARCFDYLVTRKALVGNPLRSLPRRYAVYNLADRAHLPKNVTEKRDIERDRRLTAEEERRIRLVLARSEDDAEGARALLRQAALEFLFTLALESAMRLNHLNSPLTR